MKTVFSFITMDKSYPQKLQHVYIRHFLETNGYTQVFYGAEQSYTSQNKHILLSTLKRKINVNAICFFSLKQLLGTDEDIQYDIIEKIICEGYTVIFAMEGIIINSLDDLKDQLMNIKLQQYSEQSRKFIEDFG